MSPHVPIPETRYARSGDVHIAYQAFGEGPSEVVEVLPWTSHVEYTWENPVAARFRRRLASFARVVLYDRRGAGMSDPIDHVPTLEEGADDLLALLDAAGCERATLMAHSEGCQVAIFFAATHPDRVASLVLYAPFAAPLHELSDIWSKTPQEWFELLGAIRRDWGTGANAAIYAPSAAADEELRAWYGRLERLTGSPRTRELLTRTVGRVDVRALLPSVRVPTLVLRREGDTLVPAAMARYVADAIPDARLVEVPGRDHLTVAGDPEPILAEVEHFLTGRRSAPEPDRALATVLFTDIVGSTERASSMGDREWLGLLGRHDELVRESLERFGGREVKHTGDGFLASFDGPARGVHCASSIAEQVDRLGIAIRAGLHTGECTRSGDKLEGIAVHLGARVAQEATGGEVLVTRTVKDLVIGSDLRFEARGERELKGFPGRWELYQVV